MVLTHSSSQEPDRPPASAPRIRLISIPFAGGNTYSFRDLGAHLAPFVEVVPIELPGRGRRFSEPLLTSLMDMGNDLFAQVKNQLQEPYAFYGHSLGGRLTSLMARRVLAAGLPLPLHIFVSGCPGPSVVKQRRRHELPRNDFIAMLHRMDCPPEVLENEEVMTIFEPVLRADFEANDTFDYVPEPPVDIPITVMIGRQEETTREEALAWQAETTQELDLVEFPGGHFFIFDHLPQVGEILSRKLLTALSPE
jgi:surfactin synthase thioesterase subunit